MSVLACWFEVCVHLQPGEGRGEGGGLLPGGGLTAQQEFGGGEVVGAGPAAGHHQHRQPGLVGEARAAVLLPPLQQVRQLRLPPRYTVPAQDLYCGLAIPPASLYRVTSWRVWEPPVTTAPSPPGSGIAQAYLSCII